MFFNSHNSHTKTQRVSPVMPLRSIIESVPWFNRLGLATSDKRTTQRFTQILVVGLCRTGRSGVRWRTRRWWVCLIVGRAHSL